MQKLDGISAIGDSLLMDDLKPHVKFFNLPNADLVTQCDEDDKWSPHPMIDSICQYWRDHNKLSDKQKWVLAFFLAYGTVGKGSKKPQDASDEYVGPRKDKYYDDEEVPF